LQIYNKIIGKEVEEAGTFRKVFLKKKDRGKEYYLKLQEKFKKEFYKESKNKITKKEADEIWSLISHLSIYQFNKSHAVSYAIVSFWTAFLKTYFPKEFMVSLLRNENMEDKVNLYQRECKRLGIKILKPDINKSKINFGLVKNKESIRMGLRNIKNVGTKAAINIYKNQPYKDEEDFLNKVTKRIVNKRVVEALKDANAFRF